MSVGRVRCNSLRTGYHQADPNEGSDRVGKAARRRRQARDGRGQPARDGRGTREVRGGDDAPAAANAALARLVRANPPGKISLAGAYALGYGALGMAQLEGDKPEWYDDLDPLDTLFLGTVWPQKFRDGYEFANARTAWLRLLRGTVHWRGIERFVREVLAASDEHDLPVDDGELMLLLAGRVEGAGLDQRKLPRDLLAGRALATARFVSGPPIDAELPAPPPDAAERIARLWAATEADLPSDGTASDALRDGLHVLASAGVDVHGEAMTLLPALYIGLVAGEYENLSEAGERALAWALGLSEGSPLIPVTDVLLTAPERGLSPDAVLGHLFGIPAFTESVLLEDRHWHSWPGEGLTALVFEVGFPQVITRAGKRVRLDRSQAAMLKEQLRRFEEKFGRPPGPDDPVFFDPDADEPQPLSLPGMETATVEMLEAAGIAPAWIYAYQHTGGLLPNPDGAFATDRDQADWDEAVRRHVRLHGGQIDHETETRKLRNVLVGVTLGMAADNPGYGAVLAAQLTASDPSASRDTAMLRQYLRAWEGDLISALRTEATTCALACEHARAWAGASLADRVRDAAATPAGHGIGDDVLLAAAVAVTRGRAT